jgi:tape measure domain-containing protein
MATTLETLVVKINADTSQIQRSLDRLERTTRRSAQRMTRSFDQFDRRVQGLTQSFALAQRVLGGYLGIQGLSRLVGALGDASDAYRRIEGQLRLVTGSERELAEVHGALFAIAQRTRSEFEATVGLYARMARSSEELGVSQGQLLTLTEAVNQAILISGGSAASAQAALIQLGQAMAAGALRGEELNSVMEQSPRLARAIAEGMGITVGQLRALGQEGELTAERVIEAILSQAETLRTEYAEVPETIEQANTRLGNSFDRFLVAIDEALGATESWRAGINRLAGTFDFLGQAIENVRVQAAVYARIARMIGATDAAEAVEAALATPGAVEAAMGVEPPESRPTTGPSVVNIGQGLLIPPPASTPDRDAPPRTGRGGGGGGGRAPSEETLPRIREETDALQEWIREMQRRIGLFGAERAAIAQGEIAHDSWIEAQQIIAELQREGVELTPQQIDQIEDLAQAYTEGEASLREFAEQQREVEGLWEDVGNAAFSALGRAIEQGGNLRDVIFGLISDLLQLQSVQSAIGNWLGSLFGSVDVGGLFGGGGGGGGVPFGAVQGGSDPFGGFRAEGGPVAPDRAYMVGERGPEMIVPRVPSTVIPSHALSGGGQPIVFNYSIDARGSDIGVVQRLQPLLERTKSEAVAEVMAIAGRGGPDSKVFGRRGR